MEFDPVQRRAALQAFIDAEGWTIGAWEKIAKVGGSLRKFMDGTTVTMTDKTYHRLAAGAAVKAGRPVSVAELQGLAPAQPSQATAPPPQTTMTPVPQTPGRPDIPVWASAEAGSDGAMVLVNDPIDWISRSERMRGVKDPFAFQVIGQSMSPAIDHGDQVVIHPGLIPTPGKDHVFLQTQEDGTILALVKRLLRSAGGAWRVRQFNPPKDFELPKAKWAKALMISEKRVG